MTYSIVARDADTGELGAAIQSAAFGAGVRAVQDREANILRRYKVTPIGAVHLLTASVVTGWLVFIPLVIGIFALSHFAYGMPWPSAMVSLLIFATLGILAFRAIGMIVAAAANSQQESAIIVQLLYLPMLLLSGATFPASLFPPWLAIVVQFLPAMSQPGCGRGRRSRKHITTRRVQLVLPISTT